MQFLSRCNISSRASVSIKVADRGHKSENLGLRHGALLFTTRGDFVEQQPSERLKQVGTRFLHTCDRVAVLPESQKELLQAIRNEVAVMRSMHSIRIQLLHILLIDYRQRQLVARLITAPQNVIAEHVAGSRELMAIVLIQEHSNNLLQKFDSATDCA